jgi:hypothetical protein
MGSYLLARGEKEFEKNIKKLPWEAFLPVKDLDLYEAPNVKVISKLLKCNSMNSNLFHEKKI